MRRIFLLIGALINDGYKALSIIAPFLSIAFTVAKIFDVVPQLRHVDYAWAFVPITLWLAVAYVRRWTAFQDQVEAPRPPAMNIASMSVWDIALYLFNKSEWGWRRYGQLNFWNFVRDHVPGEMRRAGREGHVRYLGAEPNTQKIIEIDRAYWNFATIDEGRIWDNRNNFFSTAAGNTGTAPAIWHYQFGSAPKIDVMRAWPPASLPLKMRVTVCVWMRRPGLLIGTLKFITAAMLGFVLGYAIRWVGWP